MLTVHSIFLDLSGREVGIELHVTHWSNVAVLQVLAMLVEIGQMTMHVVGKGPYHMHRGIRSKVPKVSCRFCSTACMMIPI